MFSAHPDDRIFHAPFCPHVRGNGQKKLIKTRKEYDANGTLTYSSSQTFDAKGNVKSSSYYQTLDGRTYSGKSTTKLTYWKGTSILKKAVERGEGYTFTMEYTKKGAPKKAVNVSDGGGTTTTTYKSSGKYPKSSVTVDQSGRKTSESTYDSKGGMKSHTFYFSDGTSQKTTYTTKYYSNGYAKKRTVTEANGAKRVATYNKQGDLVKSVQTDPAGKVTTYTYKNKYKGGYLVESKAYVNGKLSSREVYTYTSKTYTIQK